jgi:hypothetical protein
MKRFFFGMLCTAAIGGWYCPPDLSAQTQQTVGVLSKVILDVSHKETGKAWAKAQRGETLESGDGVMTGERSTAIIKFKDNTLLRLRERSRATVTGTSTSGAFSKEVNMESGAVGFDVKKQESNEEFRFTSPTSVASVRGTSGYFAMSDSVDTLTVMQHVVNLMNKRTSRGIDVEAGFTGISYRSGQIEMHRSTPAEKRAAEEALKAGDLQKQLRMQLRNRKGGTQDLILDFKE